MSRNGPSFPYFSLASLLLCLACGSSGSKDDASGGAGQTGNSGGASGSVSNGGAAGALGGRAGNAGSPPSPGGASSGGAAPTPEVSLSAFIVVDQFGYRPSSEKVAVIRDPITGFDASQAFQAGSTYAVIDAYTGESVWSGAPSAWNAGAQDPSSGDRAWWLDFSSLTRPSTYYVLDVEKGVRSPTFRIANDVYRSVLRHAMRTLFYQRAGQDKSAATAGAGWVDGPSHIGPGQDREARLFSAENDASTEKDLSGGWYDAGDFNKYTNWHAGYVVQLLRAYSQRPAIWSDDSGIPESGNGVPDILDEVKWGMDWLVRMQQNDGSVLSIVGLDPVSPPSSATGRSLYGPANTSATRSSAAAFAFGATVFGKLGGDHTAYAATLRTRAEQAWNFAEANPNVRFQNNEGASAGLGAGRQEVDDYGRSMKRLEAACYLFELTGDTKYRTIFDQDYTQAHMMTQTYVGPWEEPTQAMLLHYTKVSGATAAVATNIENVYAAGVVNGGDNLAAVRAAGDPYRAILRDYVWGSNGTKSSQGNLFQQFAEYELAGAPRDEILAAAEGYLHYLHGVNPLGLAFLSNMGGEGAERSVKEFFHAWFADGSAKWDRVGTSSYGPPPGFLTGGPNPGYAWDACCPEGCGSGNNEVCGAAPPSPPVGQPPQKSYAEFNTPWPLNSWSVTENSNAYQVAYIRLLSKFVDE